jgi:hypothetical protein
MTLDSDANGGDESPKGSVRSSSVASDGVIDEVEGVDLCCSRLYPALWIAGSQDSAETPRKVRSRGVGWEAIYHRHSPGTHPGPSTPYGRKLAPSRR